MSTLKLKECEEAFQQQNDCPFPAVLKPEGASDAASAIEWAKANVAEIERLASKHGAVLFRGLGLKDKQHFHDFIMATGWTFVMNAHVGGGGPRNKVLGPVHTSTESPPEFHIKPHHELAYISNPPSKLLFFADTPSADPIDTVGGETPILNSNRLFREIAAERPAFVQQIKDKGVRYTRVLDSRENCANKYQKCWQDVFKAETKADAEAAAKQSGHETIEWLDNGAMKVISIKFDGIRHDERGGADGKGVDTWFNAIVLLHPAAHDIDAKALWNVTYGDYSPIDDEDVRAASKLMEKVEVAFKYEQGDVLLVDNWLALHARNPFTPPRLIYAAMVE